MPMFLLKKCEKLLQCKSLSHFFSTNIFSVFGYKVVKDVRYKRIGYNIDVLRQTACLVVNPIKVKSFAYLFNCTMVGRASD